MPRSLRCSWPTLLPVLLPVPLCMRAVHAHATDPETPLAVSEGSTWEGAIGATMSHRPEYSGATTQVTKLTPALFLRYGRFTITNASGFVTRRADDVVRGLGVDLLRNERVRLGVSLRFDAGRNEKTSAALQGLGDIMGGASGTRLLGPAADSPLTTRRSNWDLNAGIARRF